MVTSLPKSKIERVAVTSLPCARGLAKATLLENPDIAASAAALPTPAALIKLRREMRPDLELITKILFFFRRQSHYRLVVVFSILFHRTFLGEICRFIVSRMVGWLV